MTNYLWMNLLALLTAVAVAIRLRERRRIVRILKISLLVVPLSFPWLYFGISRQAWAHGNPGPLFMDVPVNELALTFLMTFANAGILLLNYGTILHEAHRRAEAKHSAPQNKENCPS